MERVTIYNTVLESLFPLKRKSRDVEIVEDGVTIQDLAPAESSEGNWSAIVNGRTVLPEKWPDTKLADGSDVIFTPVPAAEVVALVVSFFSNAWVQQAIAALVIQWGISRLIGTPDIPSFEQPGDRTYSFNNLQQTASPGVPIQIVYGTHPVAGNILELDVRGYNPTELGNPYGSTMDITVGFCEGEVDAITALTVNGNDISAYSGLASWTHNVGTSDQVGLGSQGTSTTYTTSLPITAAQRVSANIWYLQGEWSGVGSGAVPVNYGVQQASLGQIPSECYGAVGGTVLATGTALCYKVSGDNPTHNNDDLWIYDVSEGSNLNTGALAAGSVVMFTGIDDLKLTLINTPYNPSRGATPPTVDQVADVGTADGANVEYSTTSSVDTLRLNISFTEGLYETTGSGQLIERTAKIQIRYRNDADTGTSWSAWIEKTLAAKQVSNFTWSIEMDFSDTVNWPIPGSISPTSPQSYHIELHDPLFQEGDGAWKQTLDSVVEILDQEYSYPNTATVRAVINADESLSGSSIPNLIATVRGRKIQKWDGVSLSNPQFENDSPDYNNPAWIVYDILTNDRYGLGPWVDSANIDLQSFIDWANWCNEQVSDGAGGTEKRATWDGVIDSKQSAWDACLTVCGSARATLFTVGEAIKVKFERDRAATQMFTMGNIIEGSFSQSFVSRLDRPTRMDIQYLRADQNYQVDTVGADNADAVAAQLPQRVTSVELAGITRESQALREARFRLNIEKLSTVVSWQSSIDAVAVEPGDIAILSHDVPKWGSSGRVVSATSNTIVLDTDVTFGPSLNQIMVRNTTTDTRETGTVHGDHTGLTVTAGSSITMAATWASTPVSLDLYAAGEASNYTKQVVVTSVRTSGSLVKTIEGVLYDPTIHNDEAAVAPGNAPLTYLPDAGQPPAVVERLTVLETGGSPSSSATAVQAAVSWQYPSGVPLGGAKIYTRSAGGSDPYALALTAQWPSTQEYLEFSTSGIGNTPATTEIAVVAFSANGAQLPPTSGSTVNFTPSGSVGIPAVVTGVTLVQDGRDLTISWDRISATSVDHYEVRRGLQWNGSVGLGTTSGLSLRTTDWVPTTSSGITENYMVRAISSTGLHGPVGIAADTNTLASWYGGSLRTQDSRASGSWTGVALTNLSIDSSTKNLVTTTSGDEARLISSTYTAATSAIHTFGVVAHTRVEWDTWEQASYAWKSYEGAALTWGGYADSSSWGSRFELYYRTRLSSVSTWSAWSPLITQGATVAFQEIEVRVAVTPQDARETLVVEQLYLVMEVAP